MKYVRITSRLNGKILSEQLYLGTDQTKAIVRFRKEYPEHNDCIVVAEPYESEKCLDHFSACVRCGCVN